MVYHDLQNAWIVLHELLHAFGIGHTQMRPDRDDYVTINWDNIRKSSHSQYRKMASVAPYGIPYDGRSIMHYKKDAFWKPVRIAQCGKLKKLLSPIFFFVKSTTYLVILLV